MTVLQKWVIYFWRKICCVLTIRLYLNFLHFDENIEVRNFLKIGLHLTEKVSFFPHCKAFYRTQVNLGSDLWVRMSVSESKRLLRLYRCDSG